MADDDAPQDDPAAQDDGAVTRAEFEGLAGKVDQVLGLLGKGKADDDAPPAGKSVAEQVREGIDRLEADRAAQAKADTEAARQADHEARLAALEEQPPGPAETWLSKAQRRIYGQEQDGSATPRKARAARS